MSGGRHVGARRGRVWIPRARSRPLRTTDWTISGDHLAECCQLFVILALGESILVAGASFGELPGSAQTVAAFVVAFIGSVALWWIYFDRGAEAGRRVISTATDQGRLARSAYSYFHIPMVAGIIAAAAADELTIAHPSNGATVATTAVILGGPALYLAGNALFMGALWEHVPLSRLVAICALAALAPLALVSSVLVVSVAATLVVVALVLWDMRAERVRLRSAELGPDRVRTPPVNIPARPRLVR
jgi:low temperature requirement protein LtrA